MNFLCASSGVSLLPARDPSPGARNEIRLGEWQDTPPAIFLYAVL